TWPRHPGSTVLTAQRWSRIMIIRVPDDIGVRAGSWSQVRHDVIPDQAILKCLHISNRFINCLLSFASAVVVFVMNASDKDCLSSVNVFLPGFVGLMCEWVLFLFDRPPVRTFHVELAELP